MSDPIDRQKVIDICNRAIDLLNGELGTGAMTAVRDWIVNLPSVKPEIIYCKDCKHWAKTCGDNQWSLGNCGLFEKRLVMCKGYCAWAERRTDESD